MGFSVGGAQVSEKHAGFVINRDNATTEDVLNLMRSVRKTVNEKFGVTLEEEIKLLNEYGEVFKL
jgi:UDP-N-acetylmuramate dehydrogenase